MDTENKKDAPKKELSAQQKIWVVFLAHIFYSTEKKIGFLLDKRSLQMIEPIIKMWDKFGPKLLLYWNCGGDHINLDDEKLLNMKYGNGYMENDLFFQTFGWEIQKAYYGATYFGFEKISYNVYEKKLFFFGDGDLNFCFQDGEFKAQHIEKPEYEEKNESWLNNFDQRFVDFFTEHIGLDFAKVEDFFTVYVSSKIENPAQEISRRTIITRQLNELEKIEIHQIGGDDKIIEISTSHSAPCFTFKVGIATQNVKAKTMEGFIAEVLYCDQMKKFSPVSYPSLENWQKAKMVKITFGDDDLIGVMEKL